MLKTARAAAVWRKSATAFSRAGNVDAYAEWALTTGYDAYFAAQGDSWITIELQLKDITARAFAAGEGLPKDEQKKWASYVLVPDEYVNPPKGIPPEGEDGVNYIIAIVRLGFFRLLRENRWLADVVTWVGLGRPADARTFAPPRPSHEEPQKDQRAPCEGTVVMGIIDDGIGFANERFRDASGGTRIEYMWWQDGVPEPGPGPIYGRERDKAQIDALLASGGAGGTPDEDRIYRSEGLLDLSSSGRQAAALRRGHGTHVMDVASGYPPSENRTDRPIVAVQVPAFVTHNTSLHSLNSPIPYLRHAVLYILNRAQRIAGGPGAPPLPVVINFSYGHLAGPHDGTSQIERELDFFIKARKQFLGVPLEVTLPSGNSHLSRCHAQVVFEDGGPDEKELYWKILPDDRTWSFLEIWLPPGSPGPFSRMQVSVTTPSGLQSVPLDEDTSSNRVLIDAAHPAHPLCSVTYTFKPSPTSRGMFLVAVRHTNATDLASPFAPSGRWTVTLHNASLTERDVVEAWVERDDTPYGYRQRGRQSYLNHDDYRRFEHTGRQVQFDTPGESLVKRAGSINALATNRHSVVMGGFERQSGDVVSYSAGGPIVVPSGSAAAHRDGPDAVATTDATAALRGVIAAGTRSGSAVAMQGTSVAAPQAARVIADALAGGPPYTQSGRDIVQARASVDNPGFPAINSTISTTERGGGARVNVELPLRPSRFWD